MESSTPTHARSIMRIGSAVLVTVSVLVVACSPKGPVQSPPPSSSAPASQAVPSGAPAAPAADKSAPPPSAGPAPAAEAPPASTPPASAQPASAQPASAQPASAQPASAQPASAHPAADARAPEKPLAADKQPAPEPPKFHEVTVPAGTVLTVRLSTSIASDTSKVEDAVRGSLT